MRTYGVAGLHVSPRNTPWGRRTHPLLLAQAGGRPGRPERLGQIMSKIHFNLLFAVSHTDFHVTDSLGASPYNNRIHKHRWNLSKKRVLSRHYSAGAEPKKDRAVLVATIWSICRIRRSA